MRLVTTSVIFHHSASKDVPIEEIAQWHKARRFKEIGYHFVIHRDGRLEVGRDVNKIGAHAKGRNWYSIGVCLLGHMDFVFPTAAQVMTAKTIYIKLCKDYKKKLTVSFHHANCPGKHLNRELFKKMLEESYAAANL